MLLEAISDNHNDTNNISEYKKSIIKKHIETPALIGLHWTTTNGIWLTSLFIPHNQYCYSVDDSVSKLVCSFLIECSWKSLLTLVWVKKIILLYTHIFLSVHCIVCSYTYIYTYIALNDPSQFFTIFLNLFLILVLFVKNRFFHFYV